MKYSTRTGCIKEPYTVEMKIISGLCFSCTNKATPSKIGIKCSLCRRTYHILCARKKYLKDNEPGEVFFCSVYSKFERNIRFLCDISEMLHFSLFHCNSMTSSSHFALKFRIIPTNSSGIGIKLAFNLIKVISRTLRRYLLYFK